MTGFGNGAISTGSDTCNIEIRSVNARFLDIKFKGIFSPHMYGEPLLDPRIVNIVEKIKKLGAKSKIVTNGDYLTINLLDKLLDAGLKILYISKHSPKLSSVARKSIEYL